MENKVKKKRKSKTEVNNDTDSDPPKKIPKISENGDTEEVSETNTYQFDLKQFRKELLSSKNKLANLTQFLNVIKNSKSIDYVSKYLELGGTPGEILKQLDEKDHKNAALNSIVFSLFNFILLKIRDSIPHLLQSIEDSCRYFLNIHVSCLEFMLSDKTESKQQKVTLNLLSSIVSLNPELGVTILNQLTLQPKIIGHLLKHDIGKDKGGVRELFIKFLMSFLIDNNTSLIKALLNKQNLLTTIIPDLVRDEAEVVISVIELLKKGILFNVNVSKTSKITMFSHYIISCLFNLFNWKPPTKTSDKADERKAQVEDNIVEFLEVLCSSNKYGIYFIDKTLGTGEVLINPYLWKAFETLEAPWNNKATSKLLLNIVKNSPDLFKPIRQLVEESLDIKSIDKFISSIHFYKEMMSALDEVNIIDSSSDLTINQIMTLFKNIYLPSTILKSCNEAIKSNDYKLKNEVILLLNFILTKIDFYLSSSYFNDKHDGKIKSDLKRKVEEFIAKQFPSTDTLVMIMHSVLDKVKSDSDFSEEIGTISMSNILINLLNLLLLQNNIESNSLDPISTMLDTKRLFDKINYIKDDKVELKLKTTMFLLRADKFAFAPDKPLFKDILLGMLEVFISDDLKMSEQAQTVLYNILDTTNIFENNRYEIDLLLYTIRSVSIKHKESTCEMLIDLIENIIKNQSKYYELHSKCLSDKNNLEISENLDEIFSNIENYNKSKKDNIFIHNSLSLSYFLTGLLKCNNKLSKKYDSFECFNNRFVSILIHMQDNPENVWNILNNYKLNENVHKYVFNWQNEPINIDKSIFGKSDLVYKLSKILLNEDTIDLKDGLKDVLDCHILFNMILFYVLQQINLDIWSLSKLKKSINLIQNIFEYCILNRNNSSNDYIRMLSRIFGNKLLIQSFSPFEIDKRYSIEPLTEFILQVIGVCNGFNHESKIVNKMLKPYKYRMYLILSSEIKHNKSIMNGSKINNLDNVLSIIDLDQIDSNNLLNEILDLDTKCLITDNNESSSYIQLICHILNRNRSNNVLLSSEIFNKITNLYSRIIKDLDFGLNVSDLEESIYNYLYNNPCLVGEIPVNIFEDIFSIKYVSKFTSKLGALLLQTNPSLIQKFVKIVVKEDVLSKREFVLPFTLAAMHHNKFKYFEDILKTIYDHYKSNITKIIEKPQKATQIYIDNVDLIVKLIYEHMDRTECVSVFKKVQKYDSVEIFHLDILEAIFIKASFDNQTTDLTYLNNYLLCILNMCINLLKRDDLIIDKVIRMSSLLERLITVIKIESEKSELEFKPWKILENNIWLNFFKQILLSHLKLDSIELNSTNIFNQMCDLIDIIYPINHQGIIELFEMTCSHSEFLNVMLNNQYINIKVNIVNLLLVLLKKNKEVMKSTHIPIYLSSYQASNCRSDKILLEMLKLYEVNGQSMDEYRPFLWGEVGSNHFALKISRKKASLWSNPTVNHVLNLLDKEKIENTIKYFNINQKLNDGFIEDDCNVLKLVDEINFINKYGLKKNFKSNSYDYLKSKLDIECYKSIWMKINNEELILKEEHLDIYDIKFIMPLLNYILTPGSAVSCHRIIRGGILAIPLMALSSYCPKMRAAAYNILFRFHNHLEAEMYYKNDKLLWSQFLSTLRMSLDSAINNEEENGLNGSTNNPRLPSICSLYLARAALVMTTPLDPLFKPINNFIISKQQINFTVVPDFLDLFHNSDIAFMERRVWILEVLRDGVKAFSDIKLLFKSVIFKILFDFYFCTLIDMKIKILIVEIMDRIICIPKASKILCDSYGLFPWLSTICKTVNPDHKVLMSKIIQLIQNLLSSLMIDSTALVLNKNNVNLDTLVSGKCFRIGESVHNHILCLLMDLIHKLSNCSIDSFKVYLNILRKLSIDNLKLLPQDQMLKLIRDCESIADPSKKYTKSALMAVEHKKINYFLPSKMLIDRKSNLEDNEVVIKYMQEVIQNWLS